MAVIEGHAEHVMDAVAPDLLPSLPQLRAALDRRRRSQSGLSRLVARLLGLELKLRQYEQGKFFCDEVVRARGPARCTRCARPGGAADAGRAARSGGMAGAQDAPGARGTAPVADAALNRRRRGARFCHLSLIEDPVHELFIPSAVTALGYCVQTYVRYFEGIS